MAIQAQRTRNYLGSMSYALCCSEAEPYVAAGSACQPCRHLPAALLHPLPVPPPAQRLRLLPPPSVEGSVRISGFRAGRPVALCARALVDS
eukprot:888178-Rhodomonas_salina.1